MKRLLTLCLLFCCLSLFSQQEFAPIGARWYYNLAFTFDTWPPGPYSLDFIVLESTGDTTIQNLNFRKVGSQFFHQEAEKVYYLRNDSLRLIYDFGVIPGDHVTFDFLDCVDSDIFPAHVVPQEYLVQKVDTVLVGNLPLKRFTCELIDIGYVHTYVYLEKVGSLRVLIEDMAKCVSFPEYVESWLRCYSENSLEYKTERFLSHGNLDCDATSSAGEPAASAFQISPNPVRNELNISTNTHVTKLRLWSVTGQLILDTPMPSDHKVDLSTVKSGVYLLQLFNENGVFLGSQRIVKQ